MSDVFLSYSRNDIDRARDVVSVLGDQGWSVWWDRDLLGGTSYDDVIDQELGDARCVLVLWSQHSVGSNWVRAEAGEGYQRGVLVPVSIDSARVPLEFRRLQTVSLEQGTHGGDPLDDLVRAVGAVVARSAPLAGDGEPFRVACPACATINVAPRRHAGKNGKCRQCGETIRLPAASSSTEAVPDAPTQLGSRAAQAAADLRAGQRSKASSPLAQRTRSMVLKLAGGVVVAALASWGGYSMLTTDDVPSGAELEEGSGDDLASGGDQRLGGADALGDPPGPGSDPLAEPTLAVAASPWEQAGLTPDQQLTELHRYVTEVDSSDKLAHAALMDLRSSDDDPAWRQRVAHTQRWQDRDRGSAVLFAKLQRDANLALESFDTIQAGSLVSEMKKLLGSAEEVPDLERRVAALGDLQRQGQTLLQDLAAGGSLAQQQSALARAEIFGREHPTHAEALHLSAALDTAYETRSAQLAATSAAVDEWSRALASTTTAAGLDRSLVSGAELLVTLPESDVEDARERIGAALDQAVAQICPTRAPCLELLRAAGALEHTADASSDPALGARLRAAIVAIAAGLPGRCGREREELLPEIARHLQTCTTACALEGALDDLALPAVAAFDVPANRSDDASRLLTQMDASLPEQLPTRSASRRETIRARLQPLADKERRRAVELQEQARDALAAGDIKRASGAYSSLRNLGDSKEHRALAALGQAECLFGEYRKLRNADALMKSGETIKAFERVLNKTPARTDQNELIQAVAALRLATVNHDAFKAFRERGEGSDKSNSKRSLDQRNAALALLDGKYADERDVEGRLFRELAHGIIGH